MPAPLSGVRILDGSTGIAGAYATKLLADLGADVLVVEPPAAPRAEPRLDPSEYESLQAGKRSCHLDLSAPAERDLLRNLVARSDLLVEGGISGHDHPSRRFDDLAAAAPHLIRIQLSPFGAGGPYAGYRANDLVLQAMSGWMFEGGDPAREPIKTGANLAEYVVGVTAALAAAAAWMHRQRTGEGQRVEVSGMEALHSATGYAPLAHSIDPATVTRRVGQDYPFAIVPCRDGWVGVNVLTPAQWEGLCAFMGRPDLLSDARFQTPRQRALQSADLTALIADWASQRTVQELFAANEWRLPITMLPTLADLLELPQHRERGFFVPQTVAGGKIVRRPRGPFLMSAVPPPAGQSAPRPGAHTDEVRREAAQPVARDTGPHARSSADTGGAPLAGIRVVDLSMWWAGPLCGALLGDLGADVVKVESRQVMDGWRGAFVDPAGAQWWETSPAFLGANRNKRGITLNLQDARGVDVFLRLLRTADVLVENYTPRVMENFGLGYARLRELRPELVMISLPAYGCTGPWRDYPGFAFPVEEMAGFPQLTGYADDGVPRRWGNAASDAVAGLNGALAVLAALEHRRRTGEGQWIELSQVEALTCFLAAPLVEFQLTGELPGRTGNRHRREAPQGVYACGGGREWLALAVDGGPAWSGLCACLERDDWAADTSLADATARWRRHDELDRAIADWAGRRSAAEATASLQAAGVPAAPVRPPHDVLADPHLQARGYFGAVNRPVVGRHTHGYRWARFSSAPLRLRRAAPTLGQHNREVLADELGLSDVELDALREADVIGDTPLGGPRL